MKWKQKNDGRWREEKERQMGIRHQQEHSGLMIWFKKCLKEKTGVTTEYSVQQHVFFFTPVEPSESIAYTRSLGMKKAGIGISVCKILNDWNKYFHKLKHTHTLRCTHMHTHPKILTHVQWERTVCRKIPDIPEHTKRFYFEHFF